MKTHLGGISMKPSNLEHCENTKTRRFLPLIEPPGIDGASSMRTLEQPQRNDALSRTPTFQPAKMLQDARMSAMSSRTAASKVVAGCFHWARLVRSRDFAKYTICA
jgi:hypothetical protein